LPYLVDVFTLQLLDQLLEAVLIGVDTDGGKDTLDVVCGWVGVTGQAEKEVGCEVLHFE